MTNAAHTASATYTTSRLHKVLGAVVALAVTFVVQGTMLAGFDHVSAKAALESPVDSPIMNAKMITLPTVTVVHGRG